MFAYQAPADLLAGRVILITGATRGIGAALARRCASLGATLVLHGRDAEALERLRDEVMTLNAAPHQVARLDLAETDPSTYAALAAAVETQHGRLDGLVHNAGLLGPRTSLEQTPAADFAQVLQVNVQAGFLLTQALLPLLQRSADASVVFTSSSVGRKGRAYWGAYSVSKFSTEGLMQVLADELENTSQVRVNSVNPGGTRTAMRASAYPAEDPRQVPAPEDVLAVYLYLLGPASRGVTGQALNAQ